MTAEHAIMDIAPDATALAQRAAAWLFARAAAAGERFTLALSGGATPRLLYGLLARPPYGAKFPWHKTHLFWSDERCVPQDDELSNFNMARQALLDHVPIPAANIHAAYHHGTPQEAAIHYEAELRAHYGHTALRDDRPLFDVTLLGLGTDGHTASLFPGTAVLDEQSAWVSAVTDHVPQPRVTLTYPALRASAQIVFLVAGADKSAILKRVLGGDIALPAARVRGGQITWFIDRAAAG